jgi:hypothetical protein
MEPEGSLPSSQELSTCTYPEPDQSSNITTQKPNKQISTQSYTNKGGRVRANEYNVEKEKIKLSVTGLGGLFSCETSRLPHRMENRFIVDGQIYPAPETSSEISSGIHLW